MNASLTRNPAPSMFAPIGRIERDFDAFRIEIKGLDGMWVSKGNAAFLMRTGAIVPVVDCLMNRQPVEVAKIYRSKSGKAFNINHPQGFFVISRAQLEKVYAREQTAARVSTLAPVPVAPTCRSSIYEGLETTF